jgi:hypothetical protein
LEYIEAASFDESHGDTLGQLGFRIAVGEALRMIEASDVNCLALKYRHGSIHSRPPKK